MEINLGGKSPNELAEEDAELMRLWGEVNNAWDQIESLLYDAFDALLMTADGYVTHAVFYSQRAHAARRDMVQEAAKVRLRSNPEQLQKLAKAIKRVKARSDDRNKLAHGRWYVSVDLAEQSTEMARIGYEPDQMAKRETYDRRRLSRVRDEMRDTAKALRTAIEPLVAERQTFILKQNAEKFGYRFEDLLAKRDAIEAAKRMDR